MDGVLTFTQFTNGHHSRPNFDSKDSLKRNLHNQNVEHPSATETLKAESATGLRNPGRSTGTRDSGVNSPGYLLLLQEQNRAFNSGNRFSYDVPGTSKPSSVSGAAGSETGNSIYDLPRFHACAECGCSVAEYENMKVDHNCAAHYQKSQIESQNAEPIEEVEASSGNQPLNSLV